jgi:hypothetical protein
MGARAPDDFVALIAREAARMHALEMPGDRADPLLWRFLRRWLGMVESTRFDAGAGPSEARVQPRKLRRQPARTDAAGAARRGAGRGRGPGGW